MRTDYKTIRLLVIALFLIQFNISAQDRDIAGNQPAWYECSDPLRLSGKQKKLAPKRLHFKFNLNEQIKNPEKLGYVWMEEFPSNHFSAQFINNTSSKIDIDLQDGSLMMIQEALNENGKWEPIEYWVYSGCGNSYFHSLELNPGEYTIIPIPVYKGEFKTKIRLKYVRNDIVYYSKAFEGSISPNQFKRETNAVNGILYHGPASYFEN